jgi:uncharacterized protein YaaQ
MIESSCKTRNEVVSSSPIMGENSFVSMPMEVHVGGATVFVIDVESHFKF